VFGETPNTPARHCRPRRTLTRPFTSNGLKRLKPCVRTPDDRFPLHLECDTRPRAMLKYPVMNVPAQGSIGALAIYCAAVAAFGGTCRFRLPIATIASAAASSAAAVQTRYPIEHAWQRAPNAVSSNGLNGAVPPFGSYTVDGTAFAPSGLDSTALIAAGTAGRCGAGTR